MSEFPEYTTMDFDTHFKVFHELMSNKVLEILLVASPYDAYILEEDGSLASKIINEYRGLNLSRPPRITRVSSASEALQVLRSENFDLVLAMPHLDDMDTFTFGQAIKKNVPNLPVIMLTHSLEGIDPLPYDRNSNGIDQVFVWSGDADLLLAIVKSVEDRLNVDRDTKRAMVRVLLLVEDSPLYLSYLLPLIYKAVVQQTQKVLDESLNEEHRLLKMRARPKILVAENYEQAASITEKFQDYLFGVISDTRFPKNGQMEENAGGELLKNIKAKIYDLPVLLLSTDPDKRRLAQTISAEFLEKSSPRLVSEINDYFLNFLGFGDFVFRDKDGSEVGRASNLRTLEKILPRIPDEPLCYHAGRNRFSNWIMARSEITLASKLRAVKVTDFSDVASMRNHIIREIHDLRKRRQMGVVVQFSAEDFDPEISDFLKIGRGSLGGKARGLAFMAHLLRESPEFLDRYHDTEIAVPRTLVITTDGFDAFVSVNKLESLATVDLTDQEIKRRFLSAQMPFELQEDLRTFLEKVTHPLSIRSSSLLEDAHYQPFSGLYKTYMISNQSSDGSDMAFRLNQLVTAIKLVYASTYYQDPRNFRSSTIFQLRKESMGVIIQEVSGRLHGSNFYPAISGIAQSQNYYPIGQLKPEDGVASISIGFGTAIGERAEGLRFCPRYPQLLPQFSKIEDILANSQPYFYSLRMPLAPDNIDIIDGDGIEKREVNMAADEWPVRFLTSVYDGTDNRLRDSAHTEGHRVVTFNSILKHEIFPLASLLCDLLALGRKGLGCPVEFEFSAEPSPGPKQKHRFHILQVKPMSASTTHFNLEIINDEIDRAYCYSTQSLGNGLCQDIRDIIYVRSDTFEKTCTIAISKEISKLNAQLAVENNGYLLIGPGRWGSFDPLLGIPVKWHDISCARVIAELRNSQMNVDPSYGSHFFHQITAQGIFYMTVSEDKADFIRWDKMQALPILRKSKYLCHIRLNESLIVKCDGRTSCCVVL